MATKRTMPERGKNAGTTKRGRGAPSKLTPEVTQKVCQAAQLGLKWASCAQYAGVSPSVLVKWRERGKKQRSGVFREFLLAVEAARAEGESAYAGVILRAAVGGDWKAAETALRLMYGYETPAKLSLNGTLRHQHAGGVLVAPAETTDEEWISMQHTAQPAEEDAG